MKNKIIQIFVIVFIVLIILLIHFAHEINFASKEIIRLQQNQQSYFSDIKQYRNKNNELVSENKGITLQLNEFKNLCSEYSDEIKRLKVRLKDVQSVSNTIVASDIPLSLPLVDSIVKVDTLRCIKYSDDFLHIDGCIEDDTLKGQIYSVDTLLQVVSVERKRFLWWKYGCKGVKQTIKSKNPHTTILYQEYISIKK
ncbi:MAG: hypothetical protein IJ748_05775 [Bacteroidales bacterium]|nr:hypothetical protein [Bacteroidales bacterium]